MTRIILRLLTDPKSWENYWNHKLKLNGNIKIDYLRFI